jgi:hypothetical protein
MVLPPLLWSASPQLASAWLALLTLSALWPLCRLGQRILKNPVGWVLPCALYASLPSSVMMGRAVWQQNVLPAMASWALWWLWVALEGEASARRRTWAAAACVLMLLFGASVHLSALAWLAVALVWLVAAFRRGGVERRALLAGGAAAALLGISFVPSALDWQRQRSAPAAEKPAYVKAFEAQMPPAKPLGGRLADALSGPLSVFVSPDATGGIERDMPAAPLAAARLADMALFLLALAGTARALLEVLHQRSLASPWALLLAWAFLPSLGAPLVLSRLNPTYFYLSMPALLLLCAGALEPLAARARWAQALAPALGLWAALFYGWFLLAALASVNRTHLADGAYYIPLRDQARVAQWAARQGVPRGQLIHLGGEWFEHSYDYLHQELYGARSAVVAPGPWALIDDQRLRRAHPRRSVFFVGQAGFRHASVAAVLLADRTKVQEFLKRFWDTPAQ